MNFDTKLYNLFRIYNRVKIILYLKLIKILILRRYNTQFNAKSKGYGEMVCYPDE